MCDWGESEESGAALKHFLIHDSRGWFPLAENLRICDTVKTNTPRLSIKGMGGVNSWRRRASCSQSQGQSMKNSTSRQGKPPSVTGSVFTIVKSKQQNRPENTECLVRSATYKSSNCFIPISEQGTVCHPRTLWLLFNINANFTTDKLKSQFRFEKKTGHEKKKIHFYFWSELSTWWPTHTWGSCVTDSSSSCKNIENTF